MREILFAGFGGQGVLTSGLILAEVAVFNGLKATWSPSYGSAMRGGSASCTVKYSKDFVYSPCMEEPDLLLAMNEPALTQYASHVKKGGIILVNSDLVPDDTPICEGVTVHRIPCSLLASEIGEPRGANIIMTSAIVKLLNDFTYEDGLRGMQDMFRKKGKQKFEEGNTKAFKAGYDAV